MTGMLPKLLAATALVALTACGNELGSSVDKGQFGNATMNNTLIQSGQISYTVALAERFNAEVLGYDQLRVQQRSADRRRKSDPA